MVHPVTEYNERGERLKTYLALNDAIKEGRASRTTILAHIEGKRKSRLWYSHLYKNDIVLPDGRVIKINTKESTNLILNRIFYGNSR